MRMPLVVIALATLSMACGSDKDVEDVEEVVATRTTTDDELATTPDTRLGTEPTDDTATTTTDVPADVDALRLAARASVANGRFSTSDVCAECHDASPTATAMHDEADRPIAPFDLWSGSMMANAGRDPLWRAVMSAEIAGTPAAADAIGQKCTTCHAPMASTDAGLQGVPRPTADVLTDGTERMDLALDGVSCTLCHQIEDDGLGTEASFSGGYVIEATGTIYGPHRNPFTHPMEQHSGFTPVASDHVSDAGLCATCHTLTTEALDANGMPTGGQVVEQAPYLEWQLSDHSDTACQVCHLPNTSEDGVPISTRIAHQPSGGDFPPIADRSPYGRHILVGGNTLIPAILRDWSSVLRPSATAAAFDATIAAARDQLSHRTATVQVLDPSHDGSTVSFAARIDVLSGHKFPTGIPLRRAWLHTTVTGSDGTVLFESGATDAAGRLVDDAGLVLPSEAAGGPLLAHVDAVTDARTVPVYESFLADGAGDVTFLLMRGEGWVKDTRLLPAGFDLTAAAAASIAPVGIGADSDFTGGGDTVHYSLDVGTTDPVQVEVEVLYQTLSARWAEEIFASGTPEALAFQVMFEAADRSPEPVAQASWTE